MSGSRCAGFPIKLQTQNILEKNILEDLAKNILEK